jgi:DNA repair exonuclease SbcCD ATPase subunit
MNADDMIIASICHDLCKADHYYFDGRIIKHHHRKPDERGHSWLSKRRLEDNGITGDECKELLLAVENHMNLFSYTTSLSVAATREQGRKSMLAIAVWAADKADAAAKEHQAAVEKLRKEYDEYKSAHPEKQPLTPPAEDKEMLEWYKKEKAEREKREQERASKEKEWQDKLDNIEKAWQDKFDAIEKSRSESEAKVKAIEEAKKASDAKLKAIEDAKAAEEAERAATLRRETINGKAKEKGIPDWMIAHGFADITPDADDAKIDEILSQYASEIQTNFLPGKNALPQFDGKQATKTDTDSLVAKLFPGAPKQQ